MLKVIIGRADMNKWAAALQLVGVGFFIGASLILGAVVGLWFDSKFDTRPVFMLVGLGIGLIMAAYGVYRMLQPLLNGKKDKGE